MSRLRDLLLKCADNLDRQCDPLNDDFLRENDVTADELHTLSEQMAVYIRGCTLAPQELAAKVMVYAVVQDQKKSGAIVGRMDAFVKSAELRKKMKNINKSASIILLGLLLGLSGCTYNYGVAPRCCGPLFWPHTGYSVVNNSGLVLDLYQDGEQIASDLGPGDVLPVRPIVLQRKSNVIAIGHTLSGEYAGTDHWTFLSGLPEVWSVGKLYRPGTTPPVWMQTQ